MSRNLLLQHRNGLALLSTPRSQVGGFRSGMSGPPVWDPGRCGPLGLCRPTVGLWAGRPVGARVCSTPGSCLPSCPPLAASGTARWVLGLAAIGGLRAGSLRHGRPSPRSSTVDALGHACRGAGATLPPGAFLAGCRAGRAQSMFTERYIQQQQDPRSLQRRMERSPRKTITWATKKVSKTRKDGKHTKHFSLTNGEIKLETSN